MNTQTETNAAPYLSYYGMVREPFGQAIEDDLFYTEPNRKQKLDILLHLAQYGNELMLVTGPTGSGKTTLLQQFQRKAPDSWRVARIEAKGGIDERRLVQQLYHQLGMEYQGASHADLVENLEHHLDALQRNARQAIMLIDDAEQLPVTALKWVLQMAELSNAEKKPLLRVILFGTDKLNENFADPILDYHADIVRRTLELGPFDREQTAHYVLHRLSVAQFAASEPFTDAALHKLHRQSAGWPGRINNLAHKLLIDTLPSATAATGVKASSTVKPLRILAAIVISGIIGALLIFQDEVNHLFNPTPKATTASNVPAPAQDTSPVPESSPSATQDSATPLATDESGSKPLIAAQETTTPVTKAAPADITEQDSLSPTPDSSPTVAEAESLSTTPAIPAAVPSPPLTSKPIASELTASEPAAPEPAAAEPVLPEPVLAKKMTAPAAAAMVKPAPAKHAEPSHDQDLLARDNRWLLAQDANHYTLQLVAGKKLATIRQYIDETLGDETELQQHLALYRSQRQGKPWFGLLLGDYPNKQAAIDARSRLPQALRRATPWVRRLGAIQRDLRQP